MTTNPGDELAWYRLLCLHRSIGKAAARALTPLLLAEDVPDISVIVAVAPDRTRTALAATLTHLATSRETVVPRDRAVAGLTAVRPLVRAHYADWWARVEDVDQIAAAAATRTDLAGFVAELTWARPPSVSTTPRHPTRKRTT